jgi:O-methyltransferase domain/Dimerisation domain
VSDETSVDPADLLGDLLFGFLGTQLLYVVAELGIADFIEDEPQAIDVLATRAEAVPDVLYRFLRALASLGVFEEVEGPAFAHTQTSLLLRRDAGSGWRDFAVVYGQVYRAFAEALPAARTGENMFHRGAGSDWWRWLAQHRDMGDAFNRAMQAGAQGRLAALADFPWEDVKTVVDVGGGNGTLILGLLEEHAHLRGVIFDLPEVAAAASARLAEMSVGARCTVEAGSFFERVPVGADVYLLAKVLHDWDDTAAVEILKSVRAAASTNSRLLVLDSVVTTDAGPQRAKVLDLVMLALVNGRERTSTQWMRLLAAGEWAPVAIRDGLIEACPAKPG